MKTEKKEPTRQAEPCILVIFGATGDLTGRKLAPALYNLGREGFLPSPFACVGFARKEKTDGQFREVLKANIERYSRIQLDEGFWDTEKEKFFYHQCDFEGDVGYESLKYFLESLDSKFGTRGNRIFYLSVPPKYFPLIIQKLHKHQLIYQGSEPWSRVIIEKPFGHDLSSSLELQQNIEKNLNEAQIYRIDHYLGKETVQNLLVFRFANSIFESLWNYKHIDHIQITVAEDMGIGTRGAFFEEEGLLRDVVQNHMMQLLSLVAMEPPVSLNADAIRDEKVKVLQSVRPFSDQDFKESIRGQYGAGNIGNQSVVGYRQEENVNLESPAETYVALRLFIDNWRWTGVPFYLRAGKRLPKRETEIAIQFKEAPGILFQEKGVHNEPNILAIRIQPDEGISLKINCKIPGLGIPLQPVKMDFLYGSYFGKTPPEAYERLIWDCMIGDSTLFARSDEVAQSWKIFTPLLEYWKEKLPSDFPNYPAGSWGPKLSEQLMGNEGRKWRILS